VKQLTASTLSLVLLLAACGGQQEGGMEGMSAEEHAMHMGGGMAGETDSTGATIRNPVHLTPEQGRALGVVYHTVGRASLERTIRTVGQVAAAEPNVADVTLKVAGYIEELLVASTGESVARGQPLLRLYGPKLVAAQEELLAASRLVSRVDSSDVEAWNNANEMLEAARRRLEYWDITAQQIEQIEHTGEISKTLTLVSPVSGVVMDKQVVAGQRVSAGTQLYRIADLSEVWIEGELFEQDLRHVRVGSMAHMEIDAYPGRHVMGRVSFIYPTLDAATRTNRMRVSVANRDRTLKPGMFATVYFDVMLGDDVVVVPNDAVLATGERHLVFVLMPDGMLHAREVTLGAQSGDLSEVIDGVAEGETIAASANFLFDAESRLASAGAMAGMDHGSMTQEDAPAMDHSEHRHD
jgi:RND family efflux transporter MFP subunit